MKEVVGNEKQAELGLVSLSAHSCSLCVWWVGQGGNADSCLHGDWLNWRFPSWVWCSF